MGSGKTPADNDGPNTRNIALLIDADNSRAADLDAVLTVLGDLGTVNIRRAYANWSKPTLRSWSEIVLQQAIEPQQQFDLTKGKNATDMKMTIDAMDLLYGGRVDGFGNANAPVGFQRACTRFIDVSALTAKASDEVAAEAKPAVDAEIVKLLGDAWKASKRDERGFARLSELGQRVANLSSFDARSYGFSRLSELIASLPNFIIEQRDNGAVFVRRVH
jgi:hypothetical protein